MKYLKTGPVKMDAFLRTLEFVLEKAGRSRRTIRKGFCFVLCIRPGGNVILEGMVGKVRDFKQKKYYTFALEKILRLSRGPLFHNSSYETRNEANEQYGGAVRGKNYFLGISGFAREHEDEAVAMAALVLHKQMDEAVAMDIATITKNKMFEQLLADCRSTNWGGD